MPHEIRDSLQRDIQMLSLRIDTVNNIQSNYSDRIDALERQAEENNKGFSEAINDLRKDTGEKLNRMDDDLRMLQGQQNSDKMTLASTIETLMKQITKLRQSFA